MFIPSSRSESRRSSHELISLNHPMPYAIVTGPKNPNEFIDCQIIIVNVRQRLFKMKKKNLTFVIFIEIMLRKLNLAFVLVVLLRQ